MPSLYEFAGFVFDPARGLQRGAALIPLAPKERRALQVLIEQGERGATKERLASAISVGRIASDQSIARCIHLLRKALAHPAGSALIATHYGSGYRLAAPVQRVENGRGSTLARSVSAANPLAVQALHTARELLGRRSRDDLRTSLRAVRQALEFDPAFVAAWVMLAQVRILQAIRGHLPVWQAYGAAAAAADQALLLAPDDAGAIACRALVRGLYEGDTARALRELDIAVETDSAYWYARYFRGWVRMLVADVARGVDEMHQAVLLAPMVPMALCPYAYALASTGKAEEALALLREAIRLQPTYDGLFATMSIVASIGGRYDEAIQAGSRTLVLAPDCPTYHAALAYALAAAGRPGEAREVLASILSAPAPGAAPSLLAPVYLALGSRETAMAQFERAAREKCPWFAFAVYDPRLRPLRSVARFPAVLAAGVTGPPPVPVAGQTAWPE